MDLLRSIQKQECSDLRDKIFGLIGVCAEIKAGEITVDYSRSAAEVYSEVAGFIINKE